MSRRTICREYRLLWSRRIIDVAPSWLIIMKGELYKAPGKNPQNVLDLGTGTGIWAIDMAE